MSQSVNNSLSNRDVPVDFVFNGVYDDVIEYSQILVNISTSSAVNSYTLTIYYSDDKLQFSTITSAYNNYTNKNLTFSPKARYFKISLTADTSIERLVVETMYKNTNIYDGSILSNLFNVNLTQSIPLEIEALPEITIANFGFTSNIVASVPLTVIGQETQHRFYATPATNTATVYADGAPGVNVNGGWLFVNTGGSNKINWYMYANTVDQASTAKKIKDIKNQYIVIYQKATEVLEVKNPFIAFYSLMDAGTNNGSWYKNRYVFDNYALQASVVGTKLLYMGDDNPLIHPEITIRIKLEFDSINSTNTLLDGSNETLWLSSVQTSSSAGAGEYNFVFSEFGLDFNEYALQPTVLPIIDNKVQVSVASLPTLNITNTGFTSNIIASVPIHTILDSVESNITMYIQERPTTNSIMSHILSATGLVFYEIPQVLRQLSINNTSSSIAFVYIYNMATVPTNLDTPTFLFAINGSNNVIFNPMDHQFTTGIAMRATTLLNGIVSPVANSIILNMTLNN